METTIPLLHWICICWFFLCLVTAIAVCILFYLRRHMYPIKAVPVLWPILTHIVVPLSVYGYLFKFIHNELNTECTGFNIFTVSSTGYYPAVPAFNTQLVHLVLVHRSQQAKLKKKFLEATEPAVAASKVSLHKQKGRQTDNSEGSHARHEIWEDDSRSHYSISHAAHHEESAAHHQKGENSATEKKKTLRRQVTERIYCLLRKEIPQKNASDRSRRRRPWWKKPWIINAVSYVSMNFLAVPAIVTTALDVYADNYDPEVCLGKSDLARYTQIGTPTVVCLVILLTAFGMRELDEAFKLKKQFKKLTYMVFVFGVPLRLLNVFVIDEDISRDVERLLFAAIYSAYTVLCGVYPLYLSYQDDLRRRRLTSSTRKTSLLMNGNSRNSISQGSPSSAQVPQRVDTITDLKNVLSNPENKQLRSDFKEYLVKEFCVENILFIDALQELKALLPEDKEQILTRAQSIDNYFLAVGSSMEINIEAKQKAAISSQVQSATVADIDQGIFDKAELEVYKMMIDPFNRFLYRQRKDSEKQMQKVASQSKKKKSPNGRKVNAISNAISTPDARTSGPSPGSKPESAPGQVHSRAQPGSFSARGSALLVRFSSMLFASPATGRSSIIGIEKPGGFSPTSAKKVAPQDRK